MSINVLGVSQFTDTNVVAAVPSITLTGNTHQIAGIENNPLNVNASAASLSLSPFISSPDLTLNVQPPTVAAVPLTNINGHTIGFTPAVGDTNVTASQGSLSLSGNAAAVTGSSPSFSFGSNGIQFLENATQSYDYGQHTSLPNLFGDGEFTLKVVIEPSQVATIGQTATAPGIRENWANENGQPGASSDWWFYGNFLLDGHNNSTFQNGTFSLQVYNSGNVRWLFGDGSGSIPLGGLWGIQNSAGINILDGQPHVIHCVRRWQSSPANSADLELWVDGVLQATVNSDVRTNMATNYWDSWAGFPANQDGWFWGAEKQAAIGDISDWADYKGVVREVAFYNGALTGGDISNDQGPADTGRTGYLDHFAFSEGAGTNTLSENGISMSLVNPGDFWLVSSNWTWDTPSLQDETDFYNNIMGWTIPANASSFTDLGLGGYAWFSSSSYGFGDMHNDTEGDNLWAWNEQFKRHGNVSVGSGSTTLDWRDDLETYYISNLLSELDNDDAGGNSGYGYDHIYGQGLAARYNESGNASILPILTDLRTRIEGRTEYQQLAASTPIPVAYWFTRGVARWAIVAAYCAEATGDPAWQTVRDNLAFGFETSTDWLDDGTSNIVAGGHYFAGRDQAFFDSEWTAGGTAEYDAGQRYNSAFSYGLAAEAVWRLYVQTGSAILRARLIAMSRYIMYYAHDPAWLAPNCSTRFGHEPNGDRVRVFGGDSGNLLVASGDPSYDMSLVNTMVIGYKLTGETEMLQFARRLFERGNRNDPGSWGTFWAQSYSHVHKYVDTQCDVTRNEFQFNKGTLQYNYQIFENGGAVPVVSPGSGPIASLASSMSSGTWALLTTTTGLGSIVTNYLNGTYGTNQGNRGFFEYATSGFWVPRYGELHFRGSGHQSAGIHIKYTESTGQWTYLSSFPAWEHQYDHSTYDTAGDRMFATTPAARGVQRWNYSSGAGTWTNVASTVGTAPSIARGLAWFPDANSGAGGLVHFNNNGNEIQVSNSAVSSWSGNLGTSITSDGNNYHSNAVYLHNHRVVMYGGGDGGQNEVGILNPDNTTRRFANVPAHWGAGDNGGMGTVLSDPVSGRIFLIGGYGNTFWELDYDAETWSALPNTPAFSLRSFASMIPTHGCIMVVSGDSTGPGANIWLYKL